MTKYITFNTELASLTAGYVTDYIKRYAITKEKIITLDFYYDSKRDQHCTTLIYIDGN